jgi:hypothetical protein
MRSRRFVVGALVAGIASIVTVPFAVGAGFAVLVACGTSIPFPLNLLIAVAVGIAVGAGLPLGLGTMAARATAPGPASTRVATAALVFALAAGPVTCVLRVFADSVTTLAEERLD